MNEAYTKTVEEVIAQNTTNLSEGLSSKEATNRLKQHGKNVIPKKDAISPFAIFISQQE